MILTLIIFSNLMSVTMIQSGRMAKYKDNSLLLATAADVLEEN